MQYTHHNARDDVCGHHVPEAVGICHSSSCPYCSPPPPGLRHHCTSYCSQPHKKCDSCAHIKQSCVSTMQAVDILKVKFRPGKIWTPWL